ncbi:DUF551 domain-containing protein [Mediterraneibacter gnavus]|uniref:DUF551 domain-containing protein n=1 Tax=Mediterraneibacter gnavus TaxID=33038 RepID=UPI00232FB8B4|nr:DUF551 domain-containing protein [Mediterraneibacter gnavus]MDB8683570.1 DUF551 domain-containing protein [Mediterraneibacter gnavus]MDB8694036.1 DUF551 domain-containing protein [Mediterraneibacter gnavus]MDB8701030.1 DUF551 domain-containing protein [Mediterraneibacter gnavus]
MNVLEKILEEKEIVAIKELIEENEKCFNQCEGACFDVEDGICNCDDGVIVQAIHKMKKYLELANGTNVPSKNGWIPVSDKLPEAGDGKYYPLLNVQTSYGAVKCGFYRVRDDRWYIYEEFYNEFIEANKKEVVAWQPLPEPYKEE